MSDTEFTPILEAYEANQSFGWYLVDTVVGCPTVGYLKQIPNMLGKGAADEQMSNSLMIEVTHVADSRVRLTKRR